MDRAQKYTLVAFYGKKSQAFSRLIKTIQSKVFESDLGDSFQPYSVEQIHATLMGLETMEWEGEVVNLNIWEELGLPQKMNFHNVVANVSRAVGGLSVGFGGINIASDQQTLVTHGQPKRTFGIDPDRGKVVLNGWPVVVEPAGHVLSDAIWNLRLTLFEQHQMRHRYHRFRDNDVFMVLGNLKTPVEGRRMEEFVQKCSEVQEKVRLMLDRSETLFEKLSPDVVQVIGYTDDALPFDSTRVYPLKVLDNESFLLDAGLI